MDLSKIKSQSKNGKYFTGKVVKCSWCGKKIYRRPSILKRSKTFACSKSCSTKYTHTGTTTWNKGKKLHYSVWNKGKKNPLMSMENHPNWKGGKLGLTNGYTGVRQKGERDYKLEHRLVMEIHLGRKLKKEEVVHHIDSNRGNNDIKNLMLFESNSAHIKHHAKLKQDAKRKKNSDIRGKWIPRN